MESKGALYIVATPIGNLADMSAHALEVLERALLIGAEDTRVTRKLLQAFEIDTPLTSVMEHSSELEIDAFLHKAEEGDIAYVSDAGTPGISDPGSKVVSRAREMGIEVLAIPGPSAVIAALSISGFPTNRFTFLGFPPVKKGRQTFFHELATQTDTVALYESKHRIKKTLEQLPEGRICFVARELTKMHESHYIGTAREIMLQLDETSSKGEFVIVLAPIDWRLSV